MTENFIQKSKNLLLDFLYAPGGFSFFPSLVFWSKTTDNINIENILNKLDTSGHLDIWVSQNKVTLYVHIPFCDKICNYCNCFKKKLTQSKQIDIYLKYLEKEAELYFKALWKKIKVSSIFIWWGTPNLLNLSQFEYLYSIITKYYDLSDLEWFILDGHPNYYNEDKLRYFAKIGVSRITLAAQSFDDEVLKWANRDDYNIDEIHKIIQSAKKYKIATNIDLLIWLQWQNISIIKRDFDIIDQLWPDNVSVHFLMLSDNMKYTLAPDYHQLIWETKKLLQNRKLPHYASNITENHYASSRNTTLSLWAESVSSLYQEIIFQKPNLNQYYKDLDKNIFPIWFSKVLNKKDEMRKYIFLNILSWVSITDFYQLFHEDIYNVFWKEIKFLFLKNITILKDNKIIPNKSDLEVLLHANILFLKELSDYRYIDSDRKNIWNYFLANWELIDK